MKWGRKQIAGVVYELGHLDPFDLDVTPKAQGAPTYKVRVTCGFHTFTRDLTDDDTPDLKIKSGSEERCFCFERYKLSKELRAMLEYAAKGRAYFSAKRDFLIVESVGAANVPHVVFFNVEKAKKGERYDAALFVTSVHLKPDLPDRLPAVTFATLIDYTVQQKLLSRPTPRRIVIVKRK